MPDAVVLVFLAALVIAVVLNALLPPRLRRLIRTGGTGALFKQSSPTQATRPTGVKDAIGSGGIALLTRQRDEREWVEER